MSRTLGCLVLELVLALAVGCSKETNVVPDTACAVGTWHCNGDELQQCNANRIWETKRRCKPGACAEGGATCDELLRDGGEAGGGGNGQGGSGDGGRGGEAAGSGGAAGTGGTAGGAGMGPCILNESNLDDCMIE